MSASPTTGVCCVEYGRLEEQTVLMVRSLRAFGGSLAHMPVIAVIGRRGAPLRPETTAELKRLGVRIVRADRGSNPASWFNYGNKAAAVVTADSLAQTDQVTWLDSDMVFMGEPTSIVLERGEELAVAPSPGSCPHLWQPRRMGWRAPTPLINPGGQRRNLQAGQQRPDGWRSERNRS